MKRLILKSHVRKRTSALVAVFLLVAGSLFFGGLGQAGANSEATASQTARGFDDQISRLYRATLGRDADPDGHNYWSNRLLQGDSIEQIAAEMLRSDEGARQSSGDIILDAYRWALGREPDAGGYAFWTSMGHVQAVIAISDSPEHRRITDTGPPPPAIDDLPQIDVVPSDPNHPGWVDAGNGVWVPPILLEIRRCESGGDYKAANTYSTARGGYQFLRSSWAAYGHNVRYGVNEAHLATPAQQDEAAVLTWERDGTRPWLASRYCWG
ncbi:MAG: hypothetical protein ACI8TP_004340 [Acidimicrobiales bacterium]|jgi:hypothetical protein